jgi:hypothetical protein
VNADYVQFGNFAHEGAQSLIVQLLPPMPVHSLSAVQLALSHSTSFGNGASGAPKFGSPLHAFGSAGSSFFEHATQSGSPSHAFSCAQQLVRRH